MGKLKPEWQKTDIPKHVKIPLWLAMKDNPTHVSWQQAIANIKFEESDDKYVRTTYDTYKALKQEIESMPKKEIDTLPDELRAWIHSIRQGSKLEETVEQQPKETTSDPRLMKHLDQLAETADILAHHVQRLLRYKDDDDIEARGDVLGHLMFWRKSNGTKVTEGTDPIGEFAYESQHPVDAYLASCLYTHYEHGFGKLPFKEWNQLSTGNVTREIVDNLKLLAHGGLKPCPNCPICKEIMD